MNESFKLTYATMFNPPEELHTHFDEALAQLKAGLGKDYGMLIGGKDSFHGGEDRRPQPRQHRCCAGTVPKGRCTGRSGCPGCGAQGLPGVEPHEVAGPCCADA